MATGDPLDDPMIEDIDLGSGFSMRYFGWKPDRSIPANAENFRDIPDIDWLGAVVTCSCGVEGVIHFDVQNARRIFPNANFWKVEQSVPLTISPSVQCHCPNMCHGYIREGRWLSA